MFTFFFFNDTATTEIYTLSLHDALPISDPQDRDPVAPARLPVHGVRRAGLGPRRRPRVSAITAESRPTLAAKARLSAVIALRSEEHTSELQSRLHLVCRLLLEKKKTIKT